MTTLRAMGGRESSPSSGLTGGRTNASTVPTAIALPIAKVSQARRSSPKNTRSSHFQSGSIASAAGCRDFVCAFRCAPAVEMPRARKRLEPTYSFSQGLLAYRRSLLLPVVIAPTGTKEGNPGQRLLHSLQMHRNRSLARGAGALLPLLFPLSSNTACRRAVLQFLVSTGLRHSRAGIEAVAEHLGQHR